MPISHHEHDHQHQHQHQHEHQHGHSHAPSETDEAALAELLDLDAEVLQSYVSDVTAWVYEHVDRLVQLILDVGAGTGTGALALLTRFDRADVIALDVSAHMLQRLGDKAASLDLADRVRTVRVDLDEAWPDAVADDTVDLVWASNSLHHMANPDRVLAALFSALRRGGLLVVMELDSFPRFLPTDLGRGRPGLEERCHEVLDEDRAEALPHIGSGWGSRLEAAGFAVEAQRQFAINLTPPLPPAVGRYAEASLRRMRPNLEGRLSTEDLDTLDALLDGGGADRVSRRTDLTVRAARSGWLARRP